MKTEPCCINQPITMDLAPFRPFSIVPQNLDLN